MDLIGSQLEETGWRQGSLIKPKDTNPLLDTVGRPYEDDIVLLVASQSCDIANNDVDSDPYIEISFAKRIQSENGNLTHNKNPRVLHTRVTCRTGDADVLMNEFIELMAFEKILICKENLHGLYPDPDRVLEDRALKSYVAWLAARYSRPALPTSFNDRIKAADPRNKLRDKVKKGSEQLTGIYVEITPDAEISENECYCVNLLGLLPAGFAGDSSKAKNVMDTYAGLLREAGDEVSIATIRRFKRFYYDDLSFKGEAILPLETTTIL